MLILQRKKNESIVINGNIQLSVLDIGTDYVKLAIDAPKNIPILRTELVEAAKVNQEACTMDTDTLSLLKGLLNEDKRKE